MAARRGKSQARRNSGSGGGIPGWAWGVLGALLAVVVIVVAPQYLKSDGDGFFRPQPNPDAQPVPVADDEAAVAPEGPATTPRRKPKPKADDAADTSEGPEYDFYTLLPGKEVPLSDAEIAASERAEAQREAAERRAAAAAASTAASAARPSSGALPQPVDGGDAVAPRESASRAANATTATAPTRTSATPASTPAVADDGTRYLLQAGAFQASGQAEEMKARIALLGLGARVESAQIGGKTVFRVRMGPYGTASDLADAKRKLATGGLPAMAIKVK